MNAAAVLTALEKISYPRNPYELTRCLSKVRILAHFGRSVRNGALLEKGFELIAEQVGMTEKTVRSTIESLIRDGVLLCEKGAGRRAHTYEIERDVRRWRAFEWSVSIAHLESDVGFATGEFRVQEVPLSVTVWSARQKRFVERPIEGRTKKRLPRGLYSAGQTEPLSDDLPGGLPDKRGDSPRSTSTSASLVDMSPPLWTPEEEERLRKVVSGLLQRVRGAWVKGEPRRKLEWLIRDGASVDDLLEAVATIPPEHQVPFGVDHVVEHWRAAQAGETPVPLRDLEREQAEARLPRLLRLIETHAEDEDELAPLRDELWAMEAKWPDLGSDNVKGADDRYRSEGDLDKSLTEAENERQEA